MEAGWVHTSLADRNAWCHSPSGVEEAAVLYTQGQNSYHSSGVSFVRTVEHYMEFVHYVAYSVITRSLSFVHFYLPMMFESKAQVLLIEMLRLVCVGQPQFVSVVYQTHIGLSNGTFKSVGNIAALNMNRSSQLYFCGHVNTVICGTIQTFSRIYMININICC